jgi:hypothetical protein
VKILTKSLIELPRKGRALIFTDIHGNIKDFEHTIDLWENRSPKKTHLIITGDIIHGNPPIKDNSREILREIKEQYQKLDTFHLLLGNHEWATLTGTSVYKGGFLNQTRVFEDSMDEMEFKDNLRFLETLPIAVKTGNGVFISHAGPSKLIKNIDDIKNITERGYDDNQPLYELLWNRYSEGTLYGDYSRKDIDIFLEAVGCRAHVVGHTPVRGTMKIGNQLIVSSSYGVSKKVYIDLDLEIDVTGAGDVSKMVKSF